MFCIVLVHLSLLYQNTYVEERGLFSSQFRSKSAKSIVLILTRHPLVILCCSEWLSGRRSVLERERAHGKTGSQSVTGVP